MEGIQEYLTAVDLHTYNEVSGEADPLEVQPESVSYLHQDQRERDRDAKLPIQDVVEEAVPGIEVFFDVPPEPGLLEEEFAEPMEPAKRIELHPTGPASAASCLSR